MALPIFSLLLRGRLAERDLSLELSDAALDRLVDVGYDPIFGARPLKRAIQRWIENPWRRTYWQGALCLAPSFRPMPPKAKTFVFHSIKNTRIQVAANGRHKV